MRQNENLISDSGVVIRAVWDLVCSVSMHCRNIETYITKEQIHRYRICFIIYFYFPLPTHAQN